MPSQTSFRKVNQNELEQLRDIAVLTFINTYQHLNEPNNFQNYINENFSLSKLTEEFNNPFSQFYFLELNDKVIGYLKLNTNDAQTDKVGENCTEIERIYVLREQQGNGFGKLLINESISIAKADNFQFIWLGVWELNKSAIAFYEKMGFVAFDTHNFKVSNELQTDILMKLSL